MKRRLILWPIVGGFSLAALAVSIIGCTTVDNWRGDTQYGADQHLKARVVASLKNDPLYKFPDVNVIAMRGQVQLSGYISRDSQRKEAVKDAAAVPGVMGVTDNMAMDTNGPVVPESGLP